MGNETSHNEKVPENDELVDSGYEVGNERTTADHNDTDNERMTENVQENSYSSLLAEVERVEEIVGSRRGARTPSAREAQEDWEADVNDPMERTFSSKNGRGAHKSRFSKRGFGRPCGRDFAPNFRGRGFHPRFPTPPPPYEELPRCEMKGPIFRRDRCRSVPAFRRGGNQAMGIRHAPEFPDSFRGGNQAMGVRHAPEFPDSCRGGNQAMGVRHAPEFPDSCRGGSSSQMERGFRARSGSRCQRSSHSSDMRGRNVTSNSNNVGVGAHAAFGESSKRDEAQGNSKTLAFQIAGFLKGLPGQQCLLSKLYGRFRVGQNEVWQIVTSSGGLFCLEGNKIYLKLKFDICKKHLSTDGCNSLSNCSAFHICPKYVDGWCKNQNCVYGHLWNSDHNNKCLKIAQLDKISIPDLRKLFKELSLLTISKESLKVCQEYVDGKCNRGESCSNIHFCLKYLSGLCLDKSRCHLNHRLTGNVTWLLKSAGISLNESPRDVLNNVCQIGSINDQITAFKKKMAEKSGAIRKDRGGKQHDGKEGKSDVNSDQKNLAAAGDDSNAGNAVSSVKAKGGKRAKTVWSYELRGDVSVPEICYESVESLCPRESGGCDKLHCVFHFYWQVNDSTTTGQNGWVNLSTDLVIELERAYCDPSKVKFRLPALDVTSLPTSCKGLFIILKGRTKWEADFGTMDLIEVSQLNQNPSHSTGNSSNAIQPSPAKLLLRRLCTQAAPSMYRLPSASVFKWYFLDKHNNWIEYGEVDSTGEEQVRCKVKSDDLEKAFQASPDRPLGFVSASHAYRLDFKRMKQINLKTNVEREVRRRPAPHIEEEERTENSDLPSTWTLMNPGERVKRVTLPSDSDEYHRVSTFIKNAGGDTLNLVKIERIQNPFHFRIFEQKVREMTSLYKNSQLVDVRQLFHGTKADCIQAICEQNLDWRLHGTNVGQVYGRGSYFSPSFSTSFRYTSADSSGSSFMLILRVAVGTITQGSSNMTRPPVNPTYFVPYDSTVDDTSNPTIIVKYDKAEYYPEYILTLR